MLLENTSLALASLQSNKLRTMLTMLGIIIGIAAVIEFHDAKHAGDDGILRSQ